MSRAFSRRTAGIVAACVLALWGLPGVAWAADARTEVAAALYGASATKVALQKMADARLQQVQAEIISLQSQSRADATKAAALSAAQERLVAEMAEKDRAYADAISGLRKSLIGIAATPEGVAALARFNAGDEEGALAALDKLRDSSDAAHARRIAYLMLEARDRGKVTIAAVIARFEDVLARDPGEAGDWQTLVPLYINAARLADAQRAADQAAKLAVFDADKIAAAAARGDIFERQGMLDQARQAYDELLPLVRRQLAAAPGDTLFQHMLAIGLLKLGEIQQLAGDPAGAYKAYAESLPLLWRLAAAAPGDIEAQREQAAALSKIVEVLHQAGDMAGARKAAEENEPALRRLAAADPGNISVQRELAHFLATLGNISAEDGDIANARRTGEESVAIMRRLAEADPDNTNAKRDLAVVLEAWSDILMAAGDPAAARLASEQQLAIARLLATDPGNAAAQRDLAGALDRMGLAQHALNDLLGATQTFQEEVSITGRLAQASGDDAHYLDMLAIALEHFGDALLVAGNLPKARQVYDDLATVRRGLALANPGSAEAQHDLADASIKAGDGRAASKDYDGALEAYRDGFLLRSRFADAVPSLRNWRAVAIAADRMGDVLLATNTLADSREAYTASLGIFRKLAAQAPDSAEAQRDLSVAMFKLARFIGGDVHWQDVAAQWEKLQDKGMLAAKDEHFLDDARRLARENPP